MNSLANSDSPNVDYLSNIFFVKGAGLYTLLLATLLVVTLWKKHNTILVACLVGIVIFQSYVAQDDKVVRNRYIFMMITSLMFLVLSHNNTVYSAPVSFANKQILGLALWVVPYLYIILAAIDRIED